MVEWLWESVLLFIRFFVILSIIATFTAGLGWLLAWWNEPEEMTDDEVSLDVLDFSPVCRCGHDAGDHASDGCIMDVDSAMRLCECEQYRPIGDTNE